MKTIHFVCNGNLYRSRTAEAIWNKHYSHIAKATSSGLLRNKSRAKFGTISWPGAYIQYTYELAPYASTDSQQTTSDILVSQDRIVVMYPSIAETFGELFPEYSNLTVLDVPDLNDLADYNAERKGDDMTLWITHNAEKAYHLIRDQLKTIADSWKD